MCICYRMRHYIAGVAILGAVGAAGGFISWEKLQNVRLESSSSAAPSDDAKKADAPIAAGPSDHVMFGGTNARNMVNLVDKDIPGDFKLEEVIKWKAQLGSHSYGGPTIADGNIYVGTNNASPRNKRDRGKPTDDFPEGPPIDMGIMMCFAEKDGKFRWQAVHDKLPNGLATDFKDIGLCSTPTVHEGRVYYVSNRCTVVCAEPNGCIKGKNAAMKGRKYTDDIDVDIIWEYDMMKELDVFPHNATVCCPLIVGDLIFIITANGVDENHINIPSPEAPSFIAISKKSGKLIWKNSAPGKKIMHGQWSNPTYGVIGGVPQVIFPGGDGWLYSFKPDTGEILWTFDANPKDSKYELGGKGTRSDFIGTPVIYKDKIYIGTGQDPEHFEGIGHFWCLDVSGKKGDVSPDLVIDANVDPPKTMKNPNSAAVWHYGGVESRPNAKRDYTFGRTMSTACIVDDICYIGELAGYLHVLDAKTGKKYWQFDLKSAIWGSAYYVDGKIFIGNEDGDLFVFKHDKNPASLDEVEIASKEPDEKAAGKKLIEVKKQIDKQYKIAKIAIDEPIRGTPAVANGVLYIMTERTLFAIKKK